MAVVPRLNTLPVGQQSVEGIHGGNVAGDHIVPHWLSDHAIALVSLTTLLAFCLRVVPLTSSSAGDEISTYFIIHGHGLSRVLHLVHSNQETSPPGYFVIAWLMNQVVADSVLAARMVSFIAGVAAVPLTYALGVLALRNRLAAMLGALLVALGPFMIFFSTEGRPFMLVMVLALISTIGLLKAVRTNTIGWWVVYGVSSAAAIYTHYTAVFLLGLQILWAAVFHRRAWKGLLIANAAVVLLYLPWVPGLRGDLNAPNVIGTLIPFSLGNVGNVTEDWWIGHPTIPLPQLPGHLAVGLATAGLVAGALAILLGGAPIARLRTMTPDRLLIPLLAVGPPLLIALYSSFRTSILEGRNFITSSPALALAMAAIVLLPTIPWARWLAVGLLLTAFSIGAVTSVLPVNQRPNVDAAVAYIDAHAGRNDPLVDMPLFDNPLSELDVALSREGESTYRPGPEEDRDPITTSPGHHDVFRLAATPLAVQLRHLTGPGGQPAGNDNAGQSPVVVAQETLKLADRVSAGEFVLVGTSLTYAGFFPNSPLAEFLRALPSDYHIVHFAEMQGFGGLFPVEVEVFQPSPHQLPSPAPDQS
jgi:hypothetical protein